MTYALAAAPQQSVFQHLTSDTAVTAALGSNLFDAMPTGSRRRSMRFLGLRRSWIARITPLISVSWCRGWP